MRIEMGFTQSGEKMSTSEVMERKPLDLELEEIRTGVTS